MFLQTQGHPLRQGEPQETPGTALEGHVHAVNGGITINSINMNRIIEVYRYFFRFSIERVKTFIDNPMMMVIVLEYLRQTQMTRVYLKNTL